MPSPEEQYDYITRTVEVTLPEGALREQIERSVETGVPLRVKLGVDPTAPDVTLGWAVVFDLLRRFQEMGHLAVLILGDFTAQVGDPSGKSATRKRLTDDEVAANARGCLPTIKSLLLDERLEIRHNSEWLGAMDMAAVLDMTASVTVSRLMDRDDFARRWKANEPISLIEFMYPLLQGTDSVAVRADVEIGGSDQLLNLLMGRDLQERAGQQPQSVATVPLLVGTDGTNKMSQSLGNYISVRDDADTMFGKTMSIPDEAMVPWFRLAAGSTTEETREIDRGLASGSLHPGEQKRLLARTIVDRYHGQGAGTDAEAAFDRVFRDKEAPVDIETFALPDVDEVWLPGLLNDAGMVTSNSEGRRMISQGAVRIDGERHDDETITRSALTNAVVQVGKRRFVRFTT
ncbi:MAG: tyrosine--tRNA ligase [Acidimicrobiia bacterium]